MIPDTSAKLQFWQRYLKADEDIARDEVAASIVRALARAGGTATLFELRSRTAKPRLEMNRAVRKLARNGILKKDDLSFAGSTVVRLSPAGWDLLRSEGKGESARWP